MSEDTTIPGFDEINATDDGLEGTFTQVVSCAVDNGSIERRRQGLRAKLEREDFERKRQRKYKFLNTFRNLLKGF